MEFIDSVVYVFKNIFILKLFYLFFDLISSVLNKM